MRRLCNSLSLVVEIYWASTCASPRDLWAAKRQSMPLVFVQRHVKLHMPPSHLPLPLWRPIKAFYSALSVYVLLGQTPSIYVYVSLSLSLLWITGNWYCRWAIALYCWKYVHLFLLQFSMNFSNMTGVIAKGRRVYLIFKKEQGIRLHTCQTLGRKCLLITKKFHF